MKKSLIIAGVIVVLAGGGLFYLLQEDSTPKEQTPSTSPSAIFPTAPLLRAGDMQFEVVTTSADQERGLGGRTSLADDYGMLFAFPKDDTYGFWMKDMLIPIDIIWLTDMGKIVTIAANVSPSTYPTPFYPGNIARYVLEVRAGLANEKGWKEGTVIPLPKGYGS